MVYEPTLMADKLRLLWHANPDFYAIWTVFIGGGGGLQFVYFYPFFLIFSPSFPFRPCPHLLPPFPSSPPPSSPHYSLVQKNPRVRKIRVRNPRGPNDRKNSISLEKIQSRSKLLISLENFNLDVLISPQKIGPRWVARSKISFSLEIFNLARNVEFFRSLGPLGFWGRKWLRQFYGHLEKMRSFCRKTHVHKIPRFRGGVFWVWGGGGSADFIFMGARIFLISVPLKIKFPVAPRQFPTRNLKDAPEQSKCWVHPIQL